MNKVIYEAKGGLATKNDIINSMGYTMVALAKNHFGETAIPVYSFHIVVKEVHIPKTKVTDSTEVKKNE